MTNRATYTPATKPVPVLCIDTQKGTVNRYIRVLYAGVGTRYVETHRFAIPDYNNKMLWDLNSIELTRVNPEGQ